MVAQCAPHSNIAFCRISLFTKSSIGCKKLWKSKLKIDVQVAYDFFLMDALYKKKCAYNWRAAHDIKQSYERPAPKKKSMGSAKFLKVHFLKPMILVSLVTKRNKKINSTHR